MPDLDAAMEEFAAMLGVEMIGPQERDLGSDARPPHRLRAHAADRTSS